MRRRSSSGRCAAGAARPAPRRCMCSRRPGHCAHKCGNSRGPLTGDLFRISCPSNCPPRARWPSRAAWNCAASARWSGPLANMSKRA
eukprot:6347629-Pyramimonas_sp.AAC.1